MSQKCGTGAENEIGSLLHELWNSSTICGTVPDKSGAGKKNSTTENTNGIIFQMITSNNGFIIMHLVLCIMFESY